MMPPDILSGEDLVEALEEGMPDYPDFIDEVRAFIREMPSKLGYGVAMTSCAYCGRDSFAVYAIPTAFPSECPYCGRRTCYATRIPGDAD